MSKAKKPFPLGKTKPRKALPKLTIGWLIRNGLSAKNAMEVRQLFLTQRHDRYEQGRKEMFNEAWKHTPIALLDNKQNLWWAKMFYKYNGTLKQKLKEV